METIRKEVQREWAYKAKYDREIAELASKGWGYWKIYNELLRVHNGKVDIAISTVMNRVREYRERYGIKGARQK